ncbi:MULTISPECIES: pentapeptide repeat-containing protein [Acinetobacter]|uniref:pentapeptide repeat-containing protein n=1 Tax=Acinetobacter TaxID=469 RepID=UPI001D0DA53A|nr:MULTISPECIES: pentapeptide repeat-containing protein [Acinetobacter]
MKLTSTEIFKNINFPEIQEYKDALFFDFSASNCDFNRAVFLACSFKNCIFRNCNLSNCRFFSNVIFDGCIFEYCDFRSVGLLGTQFEKCFFEKCDMRGLNLDSAKWTKCEIKNCNFRDISLHSWNWIECKFSGTLREIKFLGKNNSKFFLDFSDCKLDCVEFLTVISLNAFHQKIKNIILLIT